VDIAFADDFPLVMADPGLLERVVFNLVDNAVRHSGDTGPITVEAEAGHSSAKIAIRDSGPGISAAQREVMFEPFRGRSDRAGSPGLGLGLSIAQGFCEAMGGDLVVDSEAGGGVIVRIRLPLAEAASER
jgi:two-component system sensor histidine kinase KdpD